MKTLAFLACFALLASAGTLSGDIFEWEELSQPNGVVLKVFANGSLYRQEVVSASYSLELPEGEYFIVASWHDGKGLTLSAEENVSLSQEELNLDLLLLPDAGELFEELEVPEFTSDEEPFSLSQPQALDIYPLLIVSLLVLCALLGLIYFFLTKQKPLKEERVFDDSERVLQIVREEGKISQREIQKLTGFSSAKVSLILKELEKKKRVSREKMGSKKIVSLK